MFEVGKMSIRILEKYISPWVLPKEGIVGRIRWTPSEAIHEIQIIGPKKSDTELFDVVKWKTRKNRLVLSVKDLELADRFTFVSKIDSIPNEVETINEFLVLLFDKSHNLLTKETLETRIIRPMLIIEKVSPDHISLGKDRMEAEIKLGLKAKGWGDILKIRPKIEADMKVLEIVEFKPAFLTEANPFLTVSVERYIDRIIIKRMGKTRISMSFVYEDRLGNTYETSMHSVEVEIGQIIGANPEILIENKVSFGEVEKIISHPKKGEFCLVQA